MGHRTNGRVALIFICIAFPTNIRGFFEKSKLARILDDHSDLDTADYSDVGTSADRTNNPASVVIAGKLKKLLNADVPENGEPFPKINGPKPNDDVCIVGSGPAGLHMAVSLKKRGYDKLTIFEKTGRVGGKSYDTQLEGYYRSQGATFLTVDYFTNIIELAKSYGIGDLHAQPTSGVITKLLLRIQVLPVTNGLAHLSNLISSSRKCYNIIAFYFI